MPAEHERTNDRADPLREHVERTLKELPPLNDEQRDRVASLLRGGR